MLYALIIIAVLLIGFLLLRVRLRLEFSPNRKLLFIGLGRSGPQIDFQARRGQFRLFGLKLGEFRLKPWRPNIRLRRRKKKSEETKPARKKAEPSKAKKATGKARRGIVVSPDEALTILKKSARALWKYFVGMLSATIVEQAEGEIEAGFESPHLTGQAFGYYQAALGIAPAVLGRISYIPDWTGRSLSGAVRISLAWPIYRLLGESILLLFRLPIRRIIMISIRSRKGAQDG